MLSKTFNFINPEVLGNIFFLFKKTFVSIPKFFTSSPTSRNYEEGEFQRYFCKKNNEIIYFEINQKTFQSLKNHKFM